MHVANDLLYLLPKNKCAKALVHIRQAACEPEAKVSEPPLSPEGADRDLEDVAL